MITQCKLFDNLSNLDNTKLMPITKSAKKALRQNHTKRLFNLRRIKTNERANKTKQKIN